MEFHAIPIHDSANSNKYILYRPLLGLALVGNRALANLVQEYLSSAQLTLSDNQRNSDVLNYLDRLGFLRPDPTPPSTPSEPFSPTMGVLLLTNQCQLACVYCYAGAGDSPRQELRADIGKAVIDEICKNAQESGTAQFGLSFHGGGEPVKAWKVMKECVEYARSKPIPANISVTSNGLWSQKQLEWIVANMNSISLSIDGGPTTQDRQRPLRSGGGSATIAMRSLAELDKRSFAYGIRMTTTSPWSQLPEDVQYLCEHTQCKAFQAEPAFNTGRSGHAHPSDADAAAFIEAVLEAYDIAEKHGRKFHYAGSRLGWVSDVFCTAPFSALVVNPTGDLVACYEVTDRNHPLIDISTFGRVENGEIKIDQESRHHLHALMAERRAACRDCFCYWSCAGNCYTRAFFPGPDGHQVRDNLCEISRQLTERLLLRKIAAGNGVWRSQPSQPPLTYVQVESDPDGNPIWV